MKHCYKCKKSKPYNEFYKNRTTFDGYSSPCKVCLAMYNRTPEAKRNRRQAQKRYVQRHPHKVESMRLYPSSKLNLLRQRAKRDSREITLTVQDLTEILGNPCHYCGGSLPKYGCGVDKVDNSKGYTKENVVACCSLCNNIKNDRFTYEEMVKYLEVKASKNS